MSRDGGLIAKYRYNAEGQRVSKTVFPAGAAAQGPGAQAGHTTYFLWHNGRLVAEIEGTGDHAGQVLAQYLYVSEGRRATPVAKLEGARAEGNVERSDRVLDSCRAAQAGA